MRMRSDGWSGVRALVIGLVVGGMALPGSAMAFGLFQKAPKDVVLHLEFDRLKGESVRDSSSCKNHGVVTNAYRVKGVRGTGVDVSDRGGGVYCPDAPSLDLPGTFTLEAWFKLTGNVPNHFGAIFRKEGAYALRFGNGELGFLLWSEGRIQAMSSQKKTWEPSQWHHVVATADGENMHLYIDGAEDANSPKAFSGRPDDSGGICGIGSVKGRYPLNAVLDDVRILTRALTAEEVRDAYADGMASVKKEAAVTVKRERVGRPKQVFRKTPRTVKMVEDGFLYVDVEDFENYGGWRMDTQFVHLMGSPYLLAAGIGTPVDDARTEIKIPKAGRYHVWVRARNWVRDYAPGRFQVLVDGKPLAKEFGAAPTDKWTWERGGDVDLAKGKLALGLHDLTGYYGRCDAILFTTDGNYVPPEDKDAVCRERARLIGLSLEPKHAGDFDVIVVGAGSAGCPAAIAAARMGAKTALIQNRPVLGGNASKECGVPLNGAASHHANWRETGISEEAGRLRARLGEHNYSEAFQHLCDAEENLSVFLNEHVFDAIMDDEKTIKGVKAVSTLTGMVTTYNGTFFIDCTGDGWLGYFAKAEYRLGRESRHEFNEDLAPEKTDKITMSGALMGDGLGFRAKATEKPMPFTRPPWAREIHVLKGFGRRIRRLSGGEWWMEHPGTVDDLWHAEEARDELIKIAFSYWDFVKNKSDWQDKAKTFVLSAIPIMDAKRESRRLIGDYILNQNDCQAGRVFPDRISYGGWPLDVHHPQGIFSGKEGSFDCNAHVPIHTIPYRCIYSKNIENLLFAGRCSSVSHIALGTVRVQSTLATLGQAAGTAAAMCVDLKTTPRGIYQNHITDLQQILLKNDQTIPGIKNEDPDDLARKATVTASSTADYVEFGRVNVKRDKSHAMACDRAAIFPVAGMDRLETLSLFLISSNGKPTPMRLRLLGTKTLKDFAGGKELGTFDITVPGSSSGWVDVPVKLSLPSDISHVWACLPATEGISWSTMDSAPPSTGRAYGGGGSWTIHDGQFQTFATVPPLRTSTDVKPGNVINGWAREVEDNSNMWASDPKALFPQWIELDFGKPTPMNSIHLTFDTNMRPAKQATAFPPECVRDYELSVYTGKRWKKVAETEQNFQRFHVHNFKTRRVQKIRLTVKATNGDRSARVFEIRAYCE